VTRGRTGASFLVDYRVPDGQITANSFYNRLKWDALYRINRLGIYPDSRHYYDLEDRGGSTSIFTGAVGVVQDFGWIQYEANVARTTSRTEALGERTWTFAQEPAPLKSGFTVKPETQPKEIPPNQPAADSLTWLSSLFIQDTKREENQTTAQLNIKFPFRLSDQITGHLKLGGKFRWLDRFNDEEQIGRAGIQYGNSNGPNNVLTLIGQQFAEWGVDALVRQHGGLPITPFNGTYSRSDFLKGEYPLGFALDLTTMNRLTDYLSTTTEWLRYSIGSYGRDYDGDERYQAAYIMSEMSFGNVLRFIPGVRWEKDYSKYHGQRFKEVDQAFQQRPPVDFATLTNERRNEYWLPMVHLIVRPNDWLQIRLARTETLTRPDFIQYTPISTINSFSSYIRAANGLLKPSYSRNHDAAVSAYQNYVGLFTIAGFNKKVKDLIFQTRYYLIKDKFPQLPGMNLPEHWYRDASPLVDTYINNPFPATLRGIELEWQTNFWYLPSPFKGIVLNVNYTRISSEMEKRIYFLEKILVRPFPPVYKDSLIVTSRTSRAPDQPSHIANVTIGYDIGGFSARLSYLYQSDKTAFIGTESVLDGISGDYARWDLTLQQKVGLGLQLFANFNNLNNRADENFRGNALINPTYIEYYGFTVDAGIRFKL
jgi:TonB-dependent receptor